MSRMNFLLVELSMEIVVSVITRMSYDFSVIQWLKSWNEMDMTIYFKVIISHCGRSKKPITILIIIITSILKPVFLYRGLGLFDKSSSKTSSPFRTVHRINKIHSKLLSVIHQHFIPGFLRPAGSLLCNYI